MADEETERLRRDVEVLTRVCAGLLDAMKYMQRHGHDDPIAEDKRRSAERAFLRHLGVEQD